MNRNDIFRAHREFVEINRDLKDDAYDILQDSLMELQNGSSPNEVYEDMIAQLSCLLNVKCANSELL